MWFQAHMTSLNLLFARVPIPTSFLLFTLRLGDWLLEVYRVNLIMSLPGLKSFKGSLMSTVVSQQMVWIFLMMCEIILGTYW